MNRIFLFLIIAIALLLSSCATILSTKTETIQVNSQPPGAEVFVNGSPQGFTPANVVLEKNRNYNIEVRKEGFAPYSTNVTRNMSWLWMGLNVITGVPLGIAVDWVTEKGKTFNKSSIHVPLMISSTNRVPSSISAPEPTAVPAPANMTASLTTSKALIAVMPLQGKGIPQSEADLVSEALTSKILNRGRYRILERSQMEKILGEQGFQSSGICDNSTCAVELGKMLSIDYMTVGSVGKLGNTYMLNARLVSVESGEVLANSSRQIQGDLRDLNDVMDAVASDLSR